MNVLHLLNRPGVHVTWKSGKLRLGVEPGALADDELEAIRKHKAEVGGWYLLHELLRLGYRLELTRSERDVGFVLIPKGKPTEPVDFPALFALYEAYHDEAVRLLLAACETLKVHPTDWADAVQRIAESTACYAEAESQAG